MGTLGKISHPVAAYKAPSVRATGCRPAGCTLARPGGSLYARRVDPAPKGPPVNRKRGTAQELAAEHRARGDDIGWFEELYRRASGDAGQVPWADLVPNPHLLSWLEKEQVRGDGQRALVIGCGLGDDAEKLSALDFEIVAFDLSDTAIGWARKRFPDSDVDYRVANLFNLPPEYHGAFDLVFESYTLQVVPAVRRIAALGLIADCTAPGGRLVIIARAREEHEDQGEVPWPLTRTELGTLQGLRFVTEEWLDFVDESEDTPVRRFRVVVRAPGDRDG